MAPFDVCCQPRGAGEALFAAAAGKRLAGMDAGARNDAMKSGMNGGLARGMNVQGSGALPATVPAHQGAAMRGFLEANYARLHGRLQRHLGCRDLASECLHDAWLRLGEMAAQPEIHSPEAYVYRMACNLAMDRLRSNRVLQYAGDGEAELEHLADSSPGPASIAEGRLDVQCVERALRRLPLRHQSILLALRIEEKTRQEVADRHRISLRSVDTLLRQALDHCAGESGHTVLAGVSASRRGVSSSSRGRRDPQGAPGAA